MRVPFYVWLLTVLRISFAEYLKTSTQSGLWVLVAGPLLIALLCGTNVFATWLLKDSVGRRQGVRWTRSMHFQCGLRTAISSRATHLMHSPECGRTSTARNPVLHIVGAVPVRHAIDIIKDPTLALISVQALVGSILWSRGTWA